MCAAWGADRKDAALHTIVTSITLLILFFYSGEISRQWRMKRDGVEDISVLSATGLFRDIPYYESPGI